LRILNYAMFGLLFSNPSNAVSHNLRGSKKASNSTTTTQSLRHPPIQTTPSHNNTYLRKQEYIYSESIIQSKIKKNEDLNEKDKLNHTPLKWADLRRNKDMIIQLIKNGADVTLKDDQYGQSWVFRLIMKYKDLDILNAMLIRGVDVKYLNEKNNFNMTLLSEAAIFNSKELLNLLVDNGADVSALYKRYQSNWVCFLQDDVLTKLIKENIHKDEFQMMLLDSKSGSNLFSTGFRNLINCFGKHSSKNEMYKNLITLNKVLDLIPDDVMEYYDNKTQFYNYFAYWRWV
jgi:ankyrin repeat protein